MHEQKKIFYPMLKLRVLLHHVVHPLLHHPLLTPMIIAKEENTQTTNNTNKIKGKLMITLDIHNSTSYIKCAPIKISHPN